MSTPTTSMHSILCSWVIWLDCHVKRVERSGDNSCWCDDAGCLIIVYWDNDPVCDVSSCDQQPRTFEPSYGKVSSVMCSTVETTERCGQIRLCRNHILCLIFTENSLDSYLIVLRAGQHQGHCCECRNIRQLNPQSARHIIGSQKSFSLAKCTKHFSTWLALL